MSAVLVACMLALAACGPSPNIPSLDEPPPRPPVEPEATEFDAVVGPAEVFEGVVVGEEQELGEPVENPATGDTVVQSYAVLEVDRRDGTAPVEVMVPRGYVDYPPPDLRTEPLVQTDEVLRFNVLPRADGRYICAGVVCITPFR